MRLLVRHADAGRKGSTAGPDSERPLSAHGWRQAEDLVGMLAAFRVRRLLTSPLRRCRQTLEPLAAALDLEIEPFAELVPDAGADRLVDALEGPGTQHAVLCTHGEVLQELFARLAARSLLANHDEPPWHKGSIWALDRIGPLFHCRYLPPRTTQEYQE